MDLYFLQSSEFFITTFPCKLLGLHLACGNFYIMYPSELQRDLQAEKYIASF